MATNPFSQSDMKGDYGHFNIKGILKQAKKVGHSPYGGEPVKFKEHKPKGKALALAKKLLKK